MGESSRFGAQPIAQIRCAIYTRKSTEEGLEQEFNTLHAQREAAEAYIGSQKHLGWIVAEKRYDDGGYSGGDMERPALQELLKDMDSGLVQCVVVYKVDRLSRSLLDFARLMDRFEQHAVSFVSVTQQFNTTVSIGRLTLNILLSFAQFEREMISERTRDKMGAARRKGKWVGGTPVLGYDVAAEGGRLAVNPAEAKRVREIFELYRELGSLAEVAVELGRRGWKTKSWISRRGTHHEGCSFRKASLRSLLSNVTYSGRVRYRGELYPGEHAAIVDPVVWEEVNQTFSERKPGPARKRQAAPLAGRVSCQSCQRPMVATYAAKGERRYHYYVCQSAREHGWKRCRTKSVAAGLLEASLFAELQKRWSAAESREELGWSETEWQAVEQSDPDALRRLVAAIEYDGPTGTVSAVLRGAAGKTISFSYRIPARRGRSLPGFRRQAAQDTAGRPPRLARLVALAHKLEGLVQSGKVKDYVELARLGRVSATRVNQIVILGQLAPAIQEQVLFFTPDQAALVAERELREIARDFRWDRQIERFRKLVESREPAS